MLSEGGEGSWLDIFTFMDNNTRLKRIFEVVKVQSPELDQIVNLVIFKKHLDAAKVAEAQGRSFIKGIVVGAGPIGLYTAFQLFMAGMQILVVNNRPER
jgi:threonine dehydrogenase-like Zn-dependent dehydrogenase